MTYVRPHVRQDGTYVKGHYRRTRPTATAGTTPRRTSVPPPRPVHTGPTTYVHPYYRTDGTRVRGHHRSISPRAVAAGSSAGFLVFLLILLALASGPGGNSPKPTGTTPHSPSAPAQHR
ncbi:hypothetical protein [Streptomyces sp. YS-3]|uniref:hypothetical protein n=1 Tax=Streptomyces sp. YS-3 TaxID=3381352 RepID=UPI003862325E